MILAGVTDGGSETYFDNDEAYKRLNMCGEMIWILPNDPLVPGYRNIRLAPNQDELSLARLQIIQRSVYSNTEISALRDVVPRSVHDCLSIIEDYVNACRPWPMHPKLADVMPSHPFLKVNNMIFIGKDDGREIYDGVTYSGVEYRVECDGDKWRFLNMITDTEYVAGHVEILVLNARRKQLLV